MRPNFPVDGNVPPKARNATSNGIKSANPDECESAFWLGSMRSRLFKGDVVLDFGLKKLLCRSDVAQIQKLRSSLYCERLKAIELLAPEGSYPGPEKWNISKGQADFLGVTHEGAFKNHYVLIEVEGLATQEQNREKSSQWSNLSDEQMFHGVDSYWGTFLRISAAQPERTSSETEFTFEELRELQAFLAPMGVSWYPALQSLRLLEGESFWSPDWRCGDVPIEPGTSRS